MRHTRARQRADLPRRESSPFLSTQADWRGWDNTFSALLSAPGVHFAVLTADTDFKLPTVKLVHGSFMIKVAWVIRGHSNRQYAILSNASKIGFDVLDANRSTTVIAQRRGVWQSWKEDGVYVIYKHKTLVVRANGWEAHAVPSHTPPCTPHMCSLSVRVSPTTSTKAPATLTHSPTGQRDP